MSLRFNMHKKKPSNLQPTIQATPMGVLHVLLSRAPIVHMIVVLDSEHVCKGMVEWSAPHGAVLIFLTFVVAVCEYDMTRWCADGGAGPDFCRFQALLMRQGSDACHVSRSHKFRMFSGPSLCPPFVRATALS